MYALGTGNRGIKTQDAKAENTVTAENDTPTLLTYREAAERLHLGLNTTMRIARESGLLVSIGKSKRVPWPDIYDFIRNEYTV